MDNMILLTEGFTFPLFSIDPSTIGLTLINTALIVTAYYVFLHKPVMAMFEKRKEAVKTELDAAKAAKEAALESEKEYKAKLKISKAEADRIVTEAIVKARESGEEIIAKAKEDAARSRKKAEDEIERERKRAVNDIKNQITEIVVMAASAVAEKEISETDNAGIIEKFLVNVGE